MKKSIILTSIFTFLLLPNTHAALTDRPTFLYKNICLANKNAKRVIEKLNNVQGSPIFLVINCLNGTHNTTRNITSLIKPGCLITKEQIEKLPFARALIETSSQVITKSTEWQTFLQFLSDLFFPVSFLLVSATGIYLLYHWKCKRNASEA